MSLCPGRNELCNLLKCEVLPYLQLNFTNVPLFLTKLGLNYSILTTQCLYACFFLHKLTNFQEMLKSQFAIFPIYVGLSNALHYNIIVCRQNVGLQATHARTRNS